MPWIFDEATRIYHLEDGEWQARVWQDDDGEWQAYVHDGPEGAFLKLGRSVEAVQQWAEATIARLRKRYGP